MIATVLFIVILAVVITWTNRTDKDIAALKKSVKNLEAKVNAKEKK